MNRCNSCKIFCLQCTTFADITKKWEQIMKMTTLKTFLALLLQVNAFVIYVFINF